ncbi:hypothetical protein NKH47_21685 [Mesorhizobium sp. M1060]|uniref:hypothetical protein n=1 Tax=Mesorhizobium sp. M1060 TaxID=2957052 RepID=UPI003334FCEB
MSILPVRMLNILPAISILFFSFEAGADDESFMDSVLQSRVCRADMPTYTDLRYKDYCQDASEPHADLWEIDRCQRRINQINSKIYQYNSFIRLCRLKHPGDSNSSTSRNSSSAGSLDQGASAGSTDDDGLSDPRGDSGVSGRLSKAREKDKLSSGVSSEIDEEFDRDVSSGLANAQRRRDEEDRLRRKAEDDAAALKRDADNRDKIRRQMPTQPAFDLTICHHMETGTTGAGERYAQCWTYEFARKGFQTSPTGMCDTSTRTKMADGVVYLYCELR